jgi:2-dehydropantoate 2-reductase
MLEAAMREICAVALARAVPLPADVVQAVLAFIDGLPPETETSLQRDIVAGRPSELDAWTGAVVRMGRNAGVNTPVNDMIYASLLVQERAARREE